MPASVISMALAAVVLLAGAGMAAAQTSDLVSKTALRVCADPANYPMSDKAGRGFENRIADLIADKLSVPVDYTWFPMATGFIRNTLNANLCDVVIGYAQGHELVLNTNHYLVSAYTLIAPKNGAIATVTTLSDDRLNDAKIGIIAGSPPATHMVRYGLMKKSRPYPLFVDRRHDFPALNMLRDLEAGEIDAAILWGPIGGPLVKENFPDFVVVPLIAETLPPRMAFRITMGVRRGELVWKRKLNSLIRRNQGDIDAILRQAGVPILNNMGTALKTSQQ